MAGQHLGDQGIRVPHLPCGSRGERAAQTELRALRVEAGGGIVERRLNVVGERDGASCLDSPGEPLAESHLRGE